MVETFYPDSVRVLEGGIVKFNFFNWGKDPQSYFSDDIRHLTPSEVLAKKRYSRIPDENRALLEFDETYLSSMESTGNLYAIYRYAGTTPPSSGEYLPPIQPTGDSGGNFRDGYRRITDNSFDTNGMDIGFYWLTLQKTGVFYNGTKTCNKTTPPVVIEIKRKVEYKELSLKIERSGEYCPNVKLTATATYSVNGIQIDIPKGKAVFKWSLSKKGGTEVAIPSQAKYTSDINSETLSIESAYANNPLLANGEYTVHVDVSYASRNAPADHEFAVDCKGPNSITGAGIMYFQFDGPNKRKARTYAELLRLYAEPESWTQNYGRRDVVECNGLPETEFTDFFRQTNVPETDRPTGEPLPNRDKLDKIIAEMKNHTFRHLLIVGYADIKGSRDYNIQLATSRIDVVKNYLESQYPELKDSNRISVHVENKSNDSAKSCCQDNCFIERRWDRRVELFYVDTSVAPKMPEYKKCNESDTSGKYPCTKVTRRIVRKPSRPRRH